MLPSKTLYVRTAQASLTAAVLATIVACGGGGGDAGGTPPAASSSSTSSTSTSSTSSSSTTSSSSSTGTTNLGGLNCVAGSGGGTGYVLGACVLASRASPTSPLVGQTATNFQNFPATVTPSDDKTLRRYTLNVTSPFGAGAQTMDGTGENCEANSVGGRAAYATEFYADPTNPANSPRYTVLSFTQSYGLNSPQCRTATNTRAVAAFNLTTADFGLWERFLGEASIYYGGWYAARGAQGLPANGKTYSEGLAIGYRITPEWVFGMSSTVTTTGAWNGSTITLQISGDRYSSSQTTAFPTAFPTLTLTTTARTGNKVSGDVTGSGVAGIWEGEFFGPNGAEFAGRFQLTQPASGHRVTAAFALRN
jgi:hypothetical protein